MVKCELLFYEQQISFASFIPVVQLGFLVPGARSEIRCPFPDFFQKNSKMIDPNKFQSFSKMKRGKVPSSFHTFSVSSSFQTLQDPTKLLLTMFSYTLCLYKIMILDELYSDHQVDFSAPPIIVVLRAYAFFACNIIVILEGNLQFSGSWEPVSTYINHPHSMYTFFYGTMSSFARMP